jgi:hypothetical protein
MCEDPCVQYQQNGGAPLAMIMF